MRENASVVLGFVTVFLLNALLVWLYDWAFFAEVDVWRAALFFVAAEIVAATAWAVTRDAP